MQQKAAKLKKKREREIERVIVRSTDVERRLGAVQAKSTKGALLEGTRGGIGLGHVVPSAAVDLLAANQSEARAYEVLIVVEQTKLVPGGVGLGV